MRIKGLTDEDFLNFKEKSMFILSPFCDFKCDKEFGNTICQNSSLAKEKIIDIDTKKLVKRYIDNEITTAIVVGGLEPLTTGWFEDDLMPFIFELRRYTDDTVVIYTGYNLVEVEDKISRLKSFKNIIVKFGRFIPDRDSRNDNVLGIKLASDNQFAIKIS